MRCWKFMPEKRISLAGSTKAILIFRSRAIKEGSPSSDNSPVQAVGACRDA